MAGVSFLLDAAEFGQALSHLDRAVSTPRSVMDAIGAHFVFSTQQNIERETAPDGARWAPLSPRTAARRVGNGRRGFDHILRVKLRLYQSVVYEATDNSVEWGSNLVYARVHQLGGEITMPARQGAVWLKSVRRKGGGVRSRFARAGSKGAEQRTVSIGSHRVHIPARPYLGISAYDREAVPQIAADQLRHEVGR